MKKIYMFIISFVFIIPIFAQHPESMRHLSLGTAMDGEWEKLFDPIELNYYKQTYYFTQLADYFNYTENYNDGHRFESNSKLLSEYPFGISFINPYNAKLKHAFFIRYKNSQLTDDFNNGITEKKITNYQDIDADGFIDTEIVSGTKAKTYRDVENKFYFIMNHAYQYQNDFIGFKFILDNTGSEDYKASGAYDDINQNVNGFSAGDDSGENYTSNTNINTHLSYYTLNELGDFTRSTDRNDATFQFSFQRPLDNDEIRSDLIFEKKSNNSLNISDHYRASTETINQNSTDNYDVKIHYLRDYTSDNKTDSFESLLKLTYRSNQSKSPIRHLASYWSVGAGLGFFVGNVEKKTSDIIQSEVIRKDDSLHINALSKDLLKSLDEKKGDLSGFRCVFSAKNNTALSDIVSFGYGIDLNYVTSLQELSATMSNTENQTVQIGETSAEIEDFTKNKINTIKYDQDISIRDLTMQLPIGLEFKLPKKDLSDHDSFTLRNFSFRLGTCFIQKSYQEESTDKFKSNTNYTSIHYGNGDISNTTENNISLTVKHTKKEISQGIKRFSAGIGYAHSDNLTVDFGGYMDSDRDNYYIGAMFTIKR